jgi:hypothetical protein
VLQTTRTRNDDHKEEVGNDDILLTQHSYLNTSQPQITNSVGSLINKLYCRIWNNKVAPDSTILCVWRKIQRFAVSVLCSFTVGCLIHFIYACTLTLTAAPFSLTITAQAPRDLLLNKCSSSTLSALKVTPCYRPQSNLQRR